MENLLRDAPVGQLLRLLTRNRVFQYPEERSDFTLPVEYTVALANHKPKPHSSANSTLVPRDIESSSALDDLEKATPEEDLAIRKETSIAPKEDKHGHILVDWYTTDDAANPQNWTQTKKAFVSFIIFIYTFIVYTGSAIYTSSEEGVTTAFGVSITTASLGLSLYVLGYGVGPLVFSPLSEIPSIGRSPVYSITMFLFVIISIPLPLVNNLGGLLVLRFLQGFFGSPCLATGGATMQDMYSLLYLPYALSVWVIAAYCGPALGPLISGFAVSNMGWRWSLWEILWGAGPVFIVMFLLLPETAAPTILHHRAHRLRKRVGTDRFLSQSEIDQKELKPLAIAIAAIIKPIEITIKDPAVLFVQVYTAIVYGIYYSFFEVFDLVYPPMYGFTLGTIGLVFLCILVACFLAVLSYFAYLSYYLIPRLLKGQSTSQESRLVPALIACFGPPIGLFLFGWTARPSIHWIVPTIGITIYAGSAFVVLQCVFVYVPMSYPMYAASLFAANDFFRSAMACGSVLYARPMFNNLGIGKGISLLGGLSVIGVIGIFVLYWYGSVLRAKSKFAIS
ncbi:major facilitator superfamily transporter [Aspergillus heteromorphus CBS 117.55]|uniref:Major facilitator superfamily transporter n=1 Tax=Aspergillus heteromorphus CBS 117.55 TaxID=1448321 RepID=A0A317VQZ7_9EURO|nr:major facilitator superfamily transporter [Aspergillus heteromorphus CBS 117.55]PWY75447.1 major facilitator superfamily transporter [Aspergillus heteromorphus CBS 117.55]